MTAKSINRSAHNNSCVFEKKFALTTIVRVKLEKMRRSMAPSQRSMAPSQLHDFTIENSDYPVDFSVNSKPSLTSNATTSEQKIATPSKIDSTNIVPSIKSNPQFMGFSTGAGQQMPLPSNRVNIFDDIDIDSTEQSTHNVDDNSTEKCTSFDLFCELTNTPQRESDNVNTLITPSLCEYAAAIMEDDEMTFVNQNIQLKEHTPGFASGFMAEVTASSTPINKGEKYRRGLKQTRLVGTFDDIAREDYVESNPIDIKVNVSPHIKSLRMAAIEEQWLSTTKKTNVKAVPSSLFVNKLTSTQVNWKEFVEYSRPVNKPVTHTSLTENILNVTTDNATRFKFNGWDHSECKHFSRD